MEPIEKRTRLIVASAVAFALIFTGLFSYLPDSLGFSQTAAALGYEDYFDTSSLMRVDVTVTEDDWQSMIDNAMNETYVECDIALNGESVSSVGIRCKGNSSLSMTVGDRYSFKIDFGEYVKDQTFHGLDKLALNNTQSDNTFIKEYLSYYLMNKAGVKTPLFCMAEIYVNGEYWGLYLAVECIEDSFIERNFSTDGGFLYKPDGTGGMGGGNNDFDFSNQGDMTPPDTSDMDYSNFGGFSGSSSSAAALGYLGDDISLYDDIFDYAKTNDPTDADKERLINALKEISEGNLDDALDVDDAVAWLAVNALVVNDDGYLGSMLHNYYLYEQNGKLTIMPWDYNLAFGGFAGGSATSAVNSPIDTPSSSDRPLVTALLSDEECLEQYHSVLYDLATFLTDGSMDTLITKLAEMIDTSVQNDPTKECTYEEFLTAIETIRTFCKERGESILGQLDGSIPSTTEGQNADSSALIQADFQLSDMGSQGGGNGGFGGFGGFGDFDMSDFSGERPSGKGGDMKSKPGNAEDDTSSDSADAQTSTGTSGSASTVSSTDDSASADESAQDTTTDAEPSSSSTPPDMPGGMNFNGSDGQTPPDLPDGVDFGGRSGTTTSTTSIVYPAILDGAAALTLIAALMLITRRRR